MGKVRGRRTGTEFPWLKGLAGESTWASTTVALANAHRLCTQSKTMSTVCIVPTYGDYRDDSHYEDLVSLSSPSP